MAAILPQQTAATAAAPSFLSGPRLLAWGGFALVLIVAPLIFSSGASVSFLSQLGTLIIFGLSFNMLLGQGGMLSFGHAVFSGLGAFFAIYAMNMAAAGGFFVPVSLIPLVGGLAGLFFGILLGYVTTKKSGTTFAMITMGIGELVYAFSHMFPKFFGGEGGVTTNRSYGEPFLGITFGPQIQVYYLIVVWLLVCTIAMYAFTQTPLGRITNAVRDNAERVEFIGYDPRKVRYFTLIISSFFAGISGGLAAINFEIVSAESVSAVRSGDGLLFTFIGGVASFSGPILGAIAGGLLTIKLSDFTMAWQLYLGVFFILFVMYAPTGLAGMIAANWRVLRGGKFGRILPGWLAVGASVAVSLVGAVILVELSYAYTFGSQKAAAIKLLASLDGSSYAAMWATGVALLLAGALWFIKVRKSFLHDWDAVNAEITAAEFGSTS
jgi:branched-chain amino acid transport system permease protein